MATKEFYTDIDLVKVSQLTNARIHNVTTSARTTLAGTLNTSHIGLVVFDTDLNQQFFWSGAAFVSGSAPVAGAMVYQGAHSSLTTTPTSPQIGYVYVLTSAGTLTWATQTFNPSAVVQVNDQVVYRGANTWDVLQGNAVEATSSALGVIQLATSGEATTGSDTTKAITSSTLSSVLSSKALAKTYFNSAVTTTANTPLAVTHNLGLQNKDAFTISVKNSAGSEVSVDVDSTDVNSLTITTAVALTNLKVVIIGF